MLLNASYTWSLNSMGLSFAASRTASKSWPARSTLPKSLLLPEANASAPASDGAPINAAGICDACNTPPAMSFVPCQVWPGCVTSPAPFVVRAKPSGKLAMKSPTASGLPL